MSYLRISSWSIRCFHDSFPRHVFSTVRRLSDSCLKGLVNDAYPVCRVTKGIYIMDVIVSCFLGT